MNGGTATCVTVFVHGKVATVTNGTEEKIVLLRKRTGTERNKTKMYGEKGATRQGIFLKRFIN
jgi:hypothetical protein